MLEPPPHDPRHSLLQPPHPMEAAVGKEIGAPQAAPVALRIRARVALVVPTPHAQSVADPVVALEVAD